MIRKCHGCLCLQNILRDGLKYLIFISRKMRTQMRGMMHFMGKGSMWFAGGGSGGMRLVWSASLHPTMQGCTEGREALFFFKSWSVLAVTAEGGMSC